MASQYDDVLRTPIRTTTGYAYATSSPYGSTLRTSALRPDPILSQSRVSARPPDDNNDVNDMLMTRMNALAADLQRVKSEMREKLEGNDGVICVDYRCY